MILLIDYLTFLIKQGIAYEKKMEKTNFKSSYYLCGLLMSKGWKACLSTLFL